MMLIRLAVPEDAAALFHLNQLFNGPSKTTVEAVAEALGGNGQEVVMVAEIEGALVGFACVQMKRSFCYERPSAEVTEVFVKEGFRRQGVAKAMLQAAHAHCRERLGAEEFTVLTGHDNWPAQALYKQLGYSPSGEMHFSM